ncbi:CaiB/BaiF CoA transferase family protein [Marinimicrococcus flavescens]|uniref:CoA transferase n=1 Tax=Marinimicrococcus flavescens TaxID=3031815 RepID=A0AAP3UZE5_9PROT|nr:CoA transferase [Marinimicrococcus flavescens]
MAEAPASQGALAGIRVIDLTRVLSGPFCTMLLGDMGADVVKVETPGEGDPVRGQGVIRDGLSWYFASFNRNKRSITLNLRTGDGRAILADLLREADVLVENFRPGVMERLGFGRERLDSINPRLVSCSINGFGSAGPYADRPAFDFIAQAMSGLMSVNGPPGGDPLRTAPPLTDLVAGLYAAFGITAALQARTRTGRGQQVESAMVNGMLSMFAYLSAEYLATGRLPQRTGNDHPILCPYGLFHAADGEVAVAPANETILRRFLGVLELSWILDDPRYDTNEKRTARRPELRALVDQRLATRQRGEWIELLNAAGVPCGRVMNLAEVFEDPQILAQEMVIEVDQPGHGPVRMTGFPVKLDGTPCSIARPAPGLGEHTAELLAELGRDEAELERLRAGGII